MKRNLPNLLTLLRLPLTLYPFVLALTSARWPLAVLLLVTGISALEELLMELTATGWNPNQTSILQRSK